MCVNWFEDPKEVEYIIDIFEYFFTIIFMIEATLKIIGLGH